MDGAEYLYEPMNATTGDRAIHRFFEFPSGVDSDNAAFDSFVDRVRTLDLHLRPGVSHRDTLAMRMIKTLTGGRSRVSLLRCQLSPNMRTLIWKDPFASFAAVDAALRHKIPVLVTYRSIHEIAGSFKRLGWGFDLHNLHERLSAAGRIPAISKRLLSRGDGATNGAGLWALIYSELARAAQAHPDRIRIVNIDEVIRDPFQTYGGILNWLGRPLSQSVLHQISAVYGKTAPSARAMPSDRAHDRNRDLTKVSSYWRAMLSEEELHGVDAIAAAVEVQSIGRTFAADGMSQAVTAAAPA
jgi:hypothetical protein